MLSGIHSKSALLSCFYVSFTVLFGSFSSIAVIHPRAGLLIEYKKTLHNTSKEHRLQKLRQTVYLSMTLTLKRNINLEMTMTYQASFNEMQVSTSKQKLI